MTQPMQPGDLVVRPPWSTIGYEKETGRAVEVPASAMGIFISVAENVMGFINITVLWDGRQLVFSDGAWSRVRHLADGGWEPMLWAGQQLVFADGTRARGASPW